MLVISHFDTVMLVVLNLQPILSCYVSVDKSSVMVGSYGPKAEAHEHCTPSEEAPKGLIARGAYVAKSKFIDDDKNIYLEWQWAFQIKKDWD